MPLPRTRSQPSDAVDIVEVEPDQFADAHAAAVEQLEDGAVARGMRTLQFAGGDAVEQRVDLLRGHGPSGSRLRRFGSADQARRIDRDHAFAHHENGRSSRTAASLRRMRDDVQLLRVEAGQPLAQDAAGRSPRARAARFRAAKGTRETGAGRATYASMRVRRSAGRAPVLLEVARDLPRPAQTWACRYSSKRLQRAPADLGVARLLVAAQALARRFVELRQQIESDVRGLVMRGIGARDVVAQRAERGLARQRPRLAAACASAAACMPASSPVAIDST